MGDSWIECFFVCSGAITLPDEMDANEYIQVKKERVVAKTRS